MSRRFAERAPSERRQLGGFGYAIDYAKEIAADEARIAELSSDLFVRIARELMPAAEAACPNYRGWNAYQLLTYSAEGAPARAAVLGLSLSEARAWVYFCNDAPEDFGLGDVQTGDYAVGHAVDKRLDRIWGYTEAERKKALAKAKASLARHRRNAAKQGWKVP